MVNQIEDHKSKTISSNRRFPKSDFPAKTQTKITNRRLLKTNNKSKIQTKMSTKYGCGVDMEELERYDRIMREDTKKNYGNARFYEVEDDYLDCARCHKTKVEEEFAECAKCSEDVCMDCLTFCGDDYRYLRPFCGECKE